MLDSEQIDVLKTQKSILSVDDLKSNPMKRLGKGGFAVVCSGTLVNPAIRERKTVAVKSFLFLAKDKTNVDTEEHKYTVALTEIQMMRKLKCPYIIGFYGFTVIEERINIALEYMNLGSVWDAIKQPFFTEAVILICIKHILEALNYLHTQVRSIVHRDVRAENVLLHRNAQGEIQAKLADFGLSFHAGDSKIREAGCLGWLGPETLKNEYTAATDIFAFAVFVWEMLSKRSPIRSGGTEIIDRKALAEGVRLDIDQGWSEMHQKLITDSWRTDPSERPTAAQLLLFLSEQPQQSFEQPLNLVQLTL